MKGEFSLRRAARRWIYDHGYIVEPRRHVTALAMAERLRQIFADRAIDTVIDVGANVGQYGTFLRERVGFSGRIESFEPIPAVAQTLRERAAADDKWSVHQTALGSRAGTRTLNVSVYSQFSSFHETAARYACEFPVARTLEASVTTLDSMFCGKIDLSHAYLKLDTQGFDLEVLKGAKQSIRQIPALQTEISFQPLYRGMPDYDDTLAAFGRCGFRVADFFLVIADEDHAAMEFDCVMVRSEADRTGEPKNERKQSI